MGRFNITFLGLVYAHIREQQNVQNTYKLLSWEKMQIAYYETLYLDKSWTQNGANKLHRKVDESNNQPGTTAQNGRHGHRRVKMAATKRQYYRINNNWRFLNSTLPVPFYLILLSKCKHCF